MSALAEIAGLSVRYPGGAVPALADLSLAIETGEILAVIGESGSGKSTFARALIGLLPERTEISGRIGWPGLDGAPRAGRDIGCVFQDPGSSLNPVLRVGEQVGEGARRHLGLTALDHLAAYRIKRTQPCPALITERQVRGYHQTKGFGQAASRIGHQEAVRDMVADRGHLYLAFNSVVRAACPVQAGFAT